MQNETQTASDGVTLKIARRCDVAIAVSHGKLHVGWYQAVFPACRGDASARGLFQEPYMRQLRIEDCRAVFRSNKAAIHASKPEIKIVCAQLSQALKAEALDSVVLDLLRRLSVYMHPLRGNRMLEYLRFTGAVPLVKAVRRDCGKEVSGFASRLLDSWRAVLVDLQKQQATDTAGASKPNAECAAASSTSCAARQPQSDGKALLVSSSSSSSVSTSSDSEVPSRRRTAQTGGRGPSCAQLA